MKGTKGYRVPRSERNMENMDISIPQNNFPQLRSSCITRTQVRVVVVILILLGCGGVIYSYGLDSLILSILEPFHSKNTYHTEHFDFHQYCPATYQMWHHAKFLRPKLTYQQFLSNMDPQQKNLLQNTIFARAKSGGGLKDKKSLELRYCGFAARLGVSCEKGEYICSDPGPIIEAFQDQPLNIVWMNMIEDISEYTDDLQGSCYHQDVDDERCDLVSKAGNQCHEATYPDPSDHKELVGQNIFTISSKHPIISTHVHGIQVRPTDDGNPLSWFSQNGQLGSGFFSEDMDYYGNKSESVAKMFKFIDQALMMLGEKDNIHYKINHYLNKQQPGTLWYHDHSMSVTNKNVGLGLYGFYMIRNRLLEHCLPHEEDQKYILITGSPSGYSDTVLNENHFYSNRYYRMRVLNGAFRNSYNISFKTDDNQYLKFRFIGSDSSIRNQSSKQMYTSALLAPAERLDLLINFDNLVFPEGADMMEANFMLNQAIKGPLMKIFKVYQPAPSFDIDACLSAFPFSKFSDFKEEEIAVKRMRPLVTAGNLGINGHLSFHGGASQNPMVGTVEDWHFINTMSFGHPMHIHLIQYQHLEEYGLKTISVKYEQEGKTVTQQCTLYQIDFLMKNPDLKLACSDQAIMNLSKKFANNKETSADYEQACIFLANLSEHEYNTCYKHFKNQDIIRDGISGINVLQKCQDCTQESIYMTWNQDASQCQGNSGEGNRYKYICRNFTDQIPEQRKGYKQTTFVDGFHSVMVRMRWAKSHMTNEEFREAQHNKSIPFFSVAESHLIEYPGFVYHCHILPHEDNEMMRPIMMQPHKYPDGTTKTPLWQQIWYEKNNQFCSKMKDVRRI